MQESKLNKTQVLWVSKKEMDINKSNDRIVKNNVKRLYTSYLPKCINRFKEGRPDQSVSSYIHEYENLESMEEFKIWKNKLIDSYRNTTERDVKDFRNTLDSFKESQWKREKDTINSKMQNDKYSLEKMFNVNNKKYRYHSRYYDSVDKVILTECKNNNSLDFSNDKKFHKKVAFPIFYASNL